MKCPFILKKEALKAQAVAARSYALKKIEYNKDNEYDVVESVLNQVYLDNYYLKEAWGNKYVDNINKLREAVNDTSLEYLDYNGEVIDALFFFLQVMDILRILHWCLILIYRIYRVLHLCGIVPLVVLLGVLKKISSSDFYSSLGLEKSNILNFKVLKRSSTNRILNLSINSTEFTGRELYDKLGLKSTDFFL